MYSLEDRIYFDGAAAETVNTLAIVETSETSSNSDSQSASADPQTSQNSTQDEHGKALVFIDAAVADSKTIAESVDKNSVIIYLNSEQDGLRQISDYLASCSNISSVSIIAHGSDASLNLGTATLNSDSIDSVYSEFLASWKNSLSDDADIMIYSCSTASSEAGRNFVDRISALTGADVAASTDMIGKDGNWNLEYTSGLIETASINAVSYSYDLLDPANISSWDDLYAALVTNHYTNITLTAANIDASAGAYTNSITIDYSGAGGSVSITSAVDTAVSGIASYFIVADDTTVTMTGLSFSNASASAIVVQEGGSLVCNDCSFSSNSATSGGAIHADDGSSSSSYANVEIYGCTFSNNTAVDSTDALGGAIYIGNYGHLTVDDYNGSSSVFTSNSATATAPAAAVSDVHACGGAIYLKSDSVANISASFTSNNVDADISAAGASGDAIAYGGAVYAYGTVTFTESTFTSNSIDASSPDDTYIYGGAIYLNDGSLRLGTSGQSASGCTFTSNDAGDGDGGAVYVSDGTLNVYYSTFGTMLSGNSAGNYGGAVSMDYGSLAANFYNCTFTDNSASSSGGAVYCYNDPSVQVLFSSCTFTSNTALAGGVAAVEDDCNISFLSCTFTDNNATFSGSVVSAGDGTLSFSDSIFSGNSGASAISSQGTVRLTGAGQVGGGSADYLILSAGTGTVTLCGNFKVTESMTLNSGFLSLDSFNLRFDSDATCSGASSSSFIETPSSGRIIKEFDAAGSFTFALGSGGIYSPLTLEFSSISNSGIVYASLSEGQAPGFSAPNYIDRYWTLTSDISSFNAIVSASFSPDDVTGEESLLEAKKYSNGAWADFGSINFDTYTISGSVSSFSIFSAWSNNRLPVYHHGTDTFMNSDRQPGVPSFMSARAGDSFDPSIPEYGRPVIPDSLDAVMRIDFRAMRFSSLEPFADGERGVSYSGDSLFPNNGDLLPDSDYSGFSEPLFSIHQSFKNRIDICVDAFMAG